MKLRLPTESIALTKKLISYLQANDGTLRQRVIRGGFWVFISYGGDKFLNVVRSVILARLLSPDDFGLIGLAAVATGFMAVMTEVGIGQAVIHRQETTDDVLSTAWTISLLRSALLSAATFLAAGPVAVWFETPTLAPIMRVMALTFIIGGFGNIGVIVLKKELDFRTLAYFSFIATILNLVIVIIAAIIFRNAWALVLGSLSQELIMLIGSYIIHPFRPRPRWRSHIAKDLLGYGKYIFSGGIVNYFLTQGDDALVGKILGIYQLGFYRMAYNVSNMPATSITHVIGRVALPAYAKLQDNIPALQQAYLRTLKITSLLAVPVSGGLFVLAPDVVLVFYGEKWLPMVPSFMVLCIYGLERAVNASVGPLFQAKGKPQIVFYLTLIKLILLALLIYPLTIRYGILGASVASSLVAILISMNAMPLVAKTLKCTVSILLKTIAGSFAATGLMVAILFLLKSFGWFKPNIPSLMALVIIGVLSYIIGLYIFDRAAIREIKQLITLQFQTTKVSVQQVGEANT